MPVLDNPEPVRVCDPCFKSASGKDSKPKRGVPTNTPTASPQVDLLGDRVLYQTFSICPRCAYLEKRGKHC